VDTTVVSSVDTLVSGTTTVTTVVSVAVMVDVAEAVVPPMVIVVGCGLRQLQARDSFQAGCRSRFFLVKSTQLGAELAAAVEAVRL
jgi:hypothetical protein